MVNERISPRAPPASLSDPSKRPAHGSTDRLSSNAQELNLERPEAESSGSGRATGGLRPMDLGAWAATMAPAHRELWSLIHKVVLAESAGGKMAEFLLKMPNYLHTLEDSMEVIHGRRDRRQPQTDCVTGLYARLMLLGAPKTAPDVLHAPARLGMAALIRILLRRNAGLAERILQRTLAIWQAADTQGHRFYHASPPDRVELEFEGEVLTFSQAEDLEAFQGQLTRLWTALAPALATAYPRILRPLWLGLLQQLEYGDLALKATSLELYQALVLAQARPGDCRLSLASFDLLLTLTQYLASPEAQARSERERGPVERGLDLCLQEIMLWPLRDLALNQFCDEVLHLWQWILRQDNLDDFMSFNDDLQHTLYDSLTYAITHCSPGVSPQTIAPLLNWKLPSCDVLGRFIANEIVHSKREAGDATDMGQSQALEQVFNLSPTWKKIHAIAEDEEAKGQLFFQHIQWTCEIAAKVLGHLEENHPKLYWDFLSRDLKDVFVESALEKVINEPENETGYQSALSIVYQLQYFQPLETFSQQQLLKIAAIGTVPWMDGQMRLSDLRIGEARCKALIKISPMIKSVLNDEIKGLIFKSLALLPKQVAPTWRQLALGSAWREQDPTTCKTILETMSVYIHNVGSNGFLLACEMIKDALNFTDKCKTCVPTLAKIAGSLVCTRSNLTLLQGCKGEVRIVCQRCDQNRLLPKSISAKVALEDVSHLLKLVGFEDIQVKTFILGLIRPLSNHVGIDLSTASIFMNYTEESDALALKFATHLPHLLAPAVLLGDGGTMDSAAKIEDFTPSSIPLDGWLDQDKVCDFVMTCLEDCVKKAISSQGVAFVDWLCPALTDLGALKISAIQVRVIQCLMDLLLDPNCHVSTVVHSEEFLRESFSLHKLTILARMAKGMVDMGVLATFVFINSLIKAPSREAFLKQHAHHLVPELFLLCVRRQNRQPMHDLAKCGDLYKKKTRYLMVDNLQYLFPFIVTNTTASEYAECIRWLEEETKVKVDQLFPSQRQKLITELLQNFHSHTQKVLSTCQWMAMNDKDFTFKGRAGKPTKEELAEYLQPKMLGVLGYFDQKIQNPLVSSAAKLDLLRSIPDLVEFLGKANVSKVKHKIMSSLHTAYASNLPEAAPILVRAWVKFARNLDLASLGPILAPLVAMTVPFHELGYREIKELYVDLVLGKDAQLLGEWFNQLMFLPDYEAFQKVNEAIRKRIQITESTPFKVIIKSVYKCLDNENVDVMVLTLSKIKHLIQTNVDLLHGLIIGSNMADPVIGDLLHRLFAATRNSDPTVVEMAGQILGHIGAVDPGRLDMTRNLSSKTSVSLYVSDKEFSRDLIKGLVKAYLNSSDSKDSEKCSYSIQEVMKEYQIGPPSSDSGLDGGQMIWKSLTEEEREVIKPFMNSLYSIHDRDLTSSCPIYKSATGLTYADWLANWCSHLIGKVEEKKARKIFVSCKPTLKRDLRFAHFLVRHVIVNVILTAKHKDVEEIIEEVNYILNDDKLVPFGPAKGIEKIASLTIFSVLDHVVQWQTKRYNHLMATKRKSDSAQRVKSRDAEYMAVTAFLEAIPQKSLSEASFRHQAYARSLKHLEKHLRGHPEELSQHVMQIQQICAVLGEADFVAGAASLRMGEPSLSERIFELEVTGNFQDALACYEALGKSGGDEAINQGLIKCYLESDQPHLASILLRGSKSRSDNIVMRQYQTVVAWQLSQWDELGALVDESCGSNGKVPSCYTWEMGIGKLLTHAHQSDGRGFNEQLRFIKQHELHPITAMAMEPGAYNQAYMHMVKLQMLDELDSLAQYFIFPAARDLPESEAEIAKLFETLNRRSSFVQHYRLFLEPIFKLRRGVLELALHKLERHPTLKAIVKQHLGQTWLLSAKVSRKSGQLDKAFNLLIETEKYGLVDHFVEKAKLAWERNRREEATDILKRGIPVNFPWYKAGMVMKQVQKDPHELSVLGEAKLLLARFTDEAANLETESVPLLYQEAKNADPHNEDVYFYLAKFFDKQIGRNYKLEDLEGVATHVTSAIGFYCRSLIIHGSKHVHLALPRLLTLWFDLGTRLHALEKERSPAPIQLTVLKKQFAKANDFIRNWFHKIPKYFLFVNFPTLTSRLCHANIDVWNVLKDILVRTFIEYPDQVFWHMVGLFNSSFPARRERCKQIFDAALAQKRELKKFLQDALDLTKTLNRLIELPINDQSEVSMDEILPELPKLLGKSDFSSILIPNSMQLSVVLPSAEVNRDHHTPFLGGKVGFHQFKDKISVMTSKIRPKKISLIGTDGKTYGFLCKPKDDLRKDGRLLDFCYLLNELFSKDADCRKRNLHIRTYKVIPLDESNGIIEWVDNLMPFRSVMSKLYLEEHGVKHITRDDIGKFGAVKDDVENNRKKFSLLLQRHSPPVFADWFSANFLDPQTWFLARLRFIRTTAVMSMVGYILGLGDRHNENLLIDTSNGDTVHVDLNCIFEEATDLRVPEIVPFRLTQNMVHAMGPCGTAGPFQIACEASLKLMRDQRDVLMSALRPFYFDPLVEWASRRERGGPKVHEEIVNQRAVEVLKAIEERLRGIVAKMTGRSQSKTFKRPLSVSGQVNFLIKEATSEANLAQMYIGWSAYI